MQSTRQEILEYLQRRGGATVKELGRHLGLTSTGIRQHLTLLEKESLIKAREERGKVGRPALVYALSEKAEALFPKRYDVLANFLLEEILSGWGNQQAQQVLRRVAKRVADPYQERVVAKDMPQRVEGVAAIMREQGLLADWERQGDEFLLNEYTCPYAVVARQHSSICCMEVEFVRLLTGGEVKLTHSLLRGERACTYRVRPDQAS